MNYGKRATRKKQKAVTTQANKMGKKVHVSFVRFMLLLIIVLGIIGSCAVFGSVKGIIDDAPAVEDINISPLGAATFIYDDEGAQLQKLTAPSSNRMPVTIDAIPTQLQNAVVAIEDERFYEHNGIDIKGILRALVKNITSGGISEGASTITQQLLKNNVFTDWTEESSLIDSFTRKIQEQYLAVEVEKTINDKSVILENYLNTINLGAGTYGVQAAAHRYFNKDVSELTLSESATIAGITQNPTRYNPITHPEENAKRRKLVLDAMLKQEYITQEEYDTALADDVYTRIQEASTITEADTTSVYSYFVDELTDQVINDLQTQKGYTETQAYNLLYSGGLQIYTTQDPDIQQIVDEEYANAENFPEDTQYALEYALTVTNPDGTTANHSKEMLLQYFQAQDPSFDLLFSSTEEAQSYADQYKAAALSDGSTFVAETINFTPQPQSSMTIQEQSTGYVKAIMGGRGEKSASLTLNRATNTTRQPGSTFKIVSTYAPALDGKDMTLATTYMDEPYNYSNGRPVTNASRTYGGETTIREAIQNSVNTVAVQCLTEITPEYAYEYLLKFGFTTILNNEVQENGEVWSDLYQPMALGGLTLGVTNLELNAAYAAIANGGQYIKPIFYTKILDQDGNILIDNTSASTTILKESTAWLLTSAMEDVVTKGTGTALQLDNMPVAGKTGTTTSSKDQWFAGYTPYYTCTVWAGFDNNETAPDTYMQKNFQKVLWQKVMSRIHADLPYKDFEMPATVTEATVCTTTGLLARANCPSITEYFDVSNVPTTKCTQHSDYTAPSRDYSTTTTPTPTVTGGADTTDEETDDTDTDTDTDTTTETPIPEDTPADTGGAEPTDAPVDPGTEGDTPAE
ncbi:MAG: transglycosylase domain-containing protein [Lachnospiraceae bacterium]